MPYYVYILTNKKNGVFYTRITNSLSRRIFEHKLGKVKGFTKKFGLKTLVYCETYDDVRDAIQEKN